MDVFFIDVRVDQPTKLLGEICLRSGISKTLRRVKRYYGSCLTIISKPMGLPTPFLLFPKETKAIHRNPAERQKN